MIKGVNKNVIIIKNTKSEIFEQAIFIIKPAVKTITKETMMDEAKRIITERTNAILKKR